MIDHIRDGLFIGNANDARDYGQLLKYKINAVVNLAQDLDDGFGFHGVRNFKIGLTDGECNEKAYYHLAETVVLNLLSCGYSVLVHCHEGRSRSAYICTRVVAYQDGISYIDAYKILCDRRPICSGMHKHFKELLGIKF